MDLAEYARVLREHVRLIAIVTVLCVLAAGALAWTRTPLYTASTQFFVSTSTSDPSDIYTGGLFSQQRIQSYAQLITSPGVLRQVVDDLKLPFNEGVLASRIQASVPADTVLISVNVTDETPQRARAIATSLGVNFSAFVANLETLRGDGGSPVKVTTTSPAQLPAAPSSPKKLVYLLLGGLLGLILGIVGAVIREAQAVSRREPATYRVSTSRLALPAGQSADFTLLEAHPVEIDVLDDVSQIVDAPILGVVSEHNLGVTPINADAAIASNAESYDTLRANLRFLALDRGLRSLVVTSATESEGKTRIAAGIGLAFAEAGYRVVLIDGDLRQPDLSTLAGSGTRVGLVDVLAGAVTADAALQNWGAVRQNGTKLQILGSGHAAADPTSLLTPEGIRATIVALQKRADLIIFDAPALLQGDDAALLASAASGSILVTRTGTAAQQVGAAAASLRAAHAVIVGVVLNDSPRKVAQVVRAAEGRWA